MNHEEIIVYASHRQFYVQDSDPPGGTDDPAFWTKEASENRLALVDGIIGIGTGSYDFVKVRVEQHNSEPQLSLSEWDHITEAGLEVRTRLVLISGCLASSGLFFNVGRPGRYRVRCCHANLAQSVDSTGDAGDWYLVQFWPDSNMEARVLKRWSGYSRDCVETTELPPSHREELDRRLAEAEKDPGVGSPWHMVLERLKRNK